MDYKKELPLTFSKLRLFVIAFSKSTYNVIEGFKGKP